MIFLLTHRFLQYTALKTGSLGQLLLCLLTVTRKYQHSGVSLNSCSFSTHTIWLLSILLTISLLTSLKCKQRWQWWPTAILLYLPNGLQGIHLASHWLGHTLCFPLKWVFIVQIITTTCFPWKWIGVYCPKSLINVVLKFIWMYALVLRFKESFCRYWKYIYIKKKTWEEWCLRQCLSICLSLWFYFETKSHIFALTETFIVQ